MNSNRPTFLTFFASHRYRPRLPRSLLNLLAAQEAQQNYSTFIYTALSYTGLQVCPFERRSAARIFRPSKLSLSTHSIRAISVK